MIPISSISYFSGYPPHPFRDIDNESGPPVPVDQPVPHEATQGLSPSGVNQSVERPMEHQAVSPVEGSRLIQDLSGISRGVEKLDLISSDSQRPGRLTPPAPMIPGCWIPVEAFMERGRGKTPSERSDSPDTLSIPPPSRGNTIVQDPRQSHFLTISPPSSPSPATSIVPPRPKYIGRPVPIINDDSCRPPGMGMHVGNSSLRSWYSGPSHPPSPITLQDPVRQPVSYRYPGIPAEVPIQAPALPPYSIVIPPTVISRPPSVSSSDRSFYPPPRLISEPYVPGWRRDDGLWFEDGNLALRTSNVEFRVYKGPLFALSPVLKGMCAGIRTSSYSGSVRFTPLNLWDTTPEDLRHVLRFIYGGTPRVEPSFSEISAHIRFGRNYKAEKLVQRSLDYLKKFYVTELNAWLQLPTLDPPFFEPLHAIGVVNLVCLLGKDGEALLPIALMRCCTLGAQIVDGYTSENGTKETLSQADLGRCFEGKVKLLEASVRAAETLRAHMTSDECSRPRRCKEALQRFVDELLGPSEDSTSGNGAGSLANELRCLRWDLSFSLSARRAYLQEAGATVVVDEERELCPKCFVRQLEEQRKIFVRLPQMMGVSVEGWATESSAAS